MIWWLPGNHQMTQAADQPAFNCRGALMAVVGAFMELDPAELVELPQNAGFAAGDAPV